MEQAVDAFRAALEERTRDRVPLDWAGTQNNLGNALLALGEREGSAEHVEQAVAAYRSALDVFSNIGSPWFYANAQNNLARALQTLNDLRD